MRMLEKERERSVRQTGFHGARARVHQSVWVCVCEEENLWHV